MKWKPHPLRAACAGVSIAGLFLSFAMLPPAAAQQDPTPPTEVETKPDDNADHSSATPAKRTEQRDAKPPPDGTAHRTLDLSGPRATMRTFLLAMQDAAGDHPERIDDAVRCLDISEVEGTGEERAKLARSLAGRLHEIIQQIGVKLDSIPEQHEDPSYIFYKTIARDEDVPEPKVEIGRDEQSGNWLFSTTTLASVPLLEEAVKAEAELDLAKSVESLIPAARRTPRATMQTFLDAMNADPRDLGTAAQCLDPTGRDADVWELVARDLAVKLKTVMDKTAVVVLAEIPDSPEGPPFTWFTSDIGNIVIGPVDADAAERGKPFGLEKGEWRFTPKTLDKLDALYRDAEDRQIVQELQDAGIREELTLSQRVERQMPEWLRQDYGRLQVWQWLALLALLPLGSLIHLTTVAIVTSLMGRWLKRKNVTIERASQRHVARSTGVLVTIVVWHYLIREFGLPESWLATLLRGTQLAMGVMLVWVAYRYVDIIGGQIAANRDVRLTRFDDVLIPLLRTILRIFVIVAGFLVIAEWMDWEITAILGALGVGGIAVAFAAQDTIGNFFGSITVLFDRPFGIGDWITVGDVDGTVERVGFRSTRVRTFYNSVITIPNSKMVNTQVDNYGARRYRRAKTMLSITYDTPPEKIDAFCEGIRELIRLHPYTRKDYYHVYFNQFASSSLDILLYVFFEAPDWSTELRERHRLFIDILKLAKRLGVEFAYPTQTLYLDRAGASVESEVPSIEPGKDDPDAVGVTQAAKLFADTYGPKPTPPRPVIIDRAPRSKSMTEGGEGNGGE
ncbi:MAG: mechanosensitive ion channel family protein [Phycisphaerae bacterium]|jgi:MscS family membrane protein